MNVDKEILKDIVDIVLMPMEEKLLRDREDDPTSKSREEQSYREAKIALVILKTLDKKVLEEDDIEALSSEFKKLHIRDDKIIDYVRAFLYFSIKYLVKYSDKDNLLAFVNNIERYEKMFMQNLETTTVDEVIGSKEEKAEDSIDSDDDFFDFDSELVDEAINGMHYTKDEIVDAKTFMEQSYYDEDDILDIKDAIGEFDDTLEFNEAYLSIATDILQKIIVLLDRDTSFRDLELSLSMLRDKLETLDIETLTKEQKMIYKEFLSTIFLDLKKWVKEVLVEQNAKDIHYLDASLLANISQIDMTISLLDANSEGGRLTGFLEE